MKVHKAGSAVITATYESDTTCGTQTAGITVNQKVLTLAAKNQSIYVNGTVPDLSKPTKDTHYTVTGLLDGDTLGGTITMKYQKDGVEVKPGESYTVPTTAAPAFAPLSAKYFVLEGKAQQWTDGDLEFVLNSNAVVKVLIDGVEVEFTVAEDGTVTIASAVIEALEAGTHEIQFIFADGSCMTTFTK
mgnify:CR=1 FL=1